jgi:CMP-N-acetylneuraminic acid synthetase
MMTSRRVLGLVPARGGSKAIPRKNARKLGSRYLLHYTADAAYKSDCLSRVVISTDDAEIAEIGRQCGLEVPFIRPADLARDDTPMIEVAKHAIAALAAAGQEFEALCLLQPTSPLRSAETIRRCVMSLWESNADSVVSVRPVPAEFNPHWVYFLDQENFLRISTGESEPIPARQLLPPAFHRDGSVFVVRTNVLMGTDSLYGRRAVGVLSPPSEACDLDTLEQWEELEVRIIGPQSLSSDSST